MTYQVKKTVPCSICGDKSVARHLCPKHYQKAWKSGTLLAHSGITPREGFEAKIEKTDGCWLWKGTTNGYGYGVFLLPKGKPVRAHRMAYEYYVGAIPAGKVIMHLCDNPPCVNPAHLRVGTKNENNKDTASKRRHNYGTKHWNGKLTDEQINEIRESTLKQPELAKIFGVTQSHISRVKSGEVRK